MMTRMAMTIMPAAMATRTISPELYLYPPPPGAVVSFDPIVVVGRSRPFSVWRPLSWTVVGLGSSSDALGDAAATAVMAAVRAWLVDIATALTRVPASTINGRR